MAGQGRKPKPQALRVLEGDPNKARYNEHEPQYASLASEPPAWLSEEGQRLWYRLAPMLTRVGVLTEADAPAFEALCATYSAFREKPDDMRIIQRLQSMLSEFGCTPSSRSRLTGATNKEAADPMERLLAGGM